MTIDALRVKDALETEVKRFQDMVFASYFPNEIFDSKCIKYKKCMFNDIEHMVVLYVPAYLKTNEMRSGVKDERFAKFRAEKAWCVCILDTFWMKCQDSLLHDGYKPCWYKKNEWVLPDEWNDKTQAMCASGIHFFNHWIPAYYYGTTKPSGDVDICFSETGSGAIFWVRDAKNFYSSTIADKMEKYFGITDVSIV